MLSVGEGAFNSTTALASITVDSVNPAYTSVAGVLYNKTITQVVAYPAGKVATSYTIPSGVTSIGNFAFYKALNLASIVLDSGITTIGDFAFYGASGLTGIGIPAAVTTIGDEAFNNATALTTVTFATGSLLTAIGDFAFSDARALTSITIPAGVTSIKQGTFANTIALSSVVFAPGSMLATIESEAFRGFRATELTLPVGVTAIGIDAFRSASFLKRVFFMGNKPTIGTDAFTGLTSATAYVKVTATGYPAVGSLMDGLTIAVGHTVTYDTKGGSTLAPGFWLWYESIVAPLPPTRTGHIFAGWSATDGGSALTFPYTPSTLAATTLYARWTALGSTPTPSPRPDMFKKIDSGTSFTLAMRQDGKLVTWGFNNTNQAQIPLGLINVIMSDIDVAHKGNLVLD